MDESRIEISGEQRRKEWLNRLGAEFLKLEPLFPVKFLPDGEYPAWVRRVEHEFGKMVFTVADMKEGADMSPRQMGALLGHQCANAVWIRDWFVAQLEAAEASGEPARVTEEEAKKGAAFLEQLFGKWYPAMCRLAKRALCSSVDQSYDDMTNFLIAFSQAFARKPKSFIVGNLGNTTFEIYLFFLLAWPLVERLKSVRELHEVLVKVFGPHRTGDMKRIEKICQRIGKSFRKPGRPKSS